MRCIYGLSSGPDLAVKYATLAYRLAYTAAEVYRSRVSQKVTAKAKPEPKNESVLIRLSKKRRAQLTLEAQARGLSLSAYLRREDESRAS